MGKRRRYRKIADQFVVAVQLNLDTHGFAYRKWGAKQRCKPGDWIVNNAGDHYTVDKKSFATTYRQISPGIFVKATPIWAEVATRASEVNTKEGTTHCQVGDYLVFNNEDGTDAYCICAATFESMYEPDE